MKTLSPLRTIALLLALLISGVSAALAHHGFTGRYDISAPLWIEGEVTKVYFGQPHAELTIRTSADLSLPDAAPDLAGADDVITAQALAVREDTKAREIEIEFPPIRIFFDLGSSVSVGDRVAVIAFRNCEPPHQLRGQWIKPQDGAPVARSGRLQYQVEGC